MWVRSWRQFRKIPFFSCSSKHLSSFFQIIFATGEPIYVTQETLPKNDEHNPYRRGTVSNNIARLQFSKEKLSVAWRTYFCDDKVTLHLS